MHAAAVNTLARRAPTTIRRRALAGDPRAASITGQVSRRALGRGSSTDR
jgi:hypothetical protein